MVLRAASNFMHRCSRTNRYLRSAIVPCLFAGRPCFILDLILTRISRHFLFTILTAKFQWKLWLDWLTCSPSCQSKTIGNMRWKLIENRKSYRKFSRSDKRFNRYLFFVNFNWILFIRISHDRDPLERAFPTIFSQRYFPSISTPEKFKMSFVSNKEMSAFSGRIAWMSQWNVNTQPSTLRKSSIICTIGKSFNRAVKYVFDMPGPKTATVPMIQALRKAGMNIVRLNFSHGSHEVFSFVLGNRR